MAELNDLIYHFSNDGLNINVEIRPLVKCKECKHLGENDGYYFCNATGIAFGDKPNWFCADGERKEQSDG